MAPLLTLTQPRLCLRFPVLAGAGMSKDTLSTALKEFNFAAVKLCLEQNKLDRDALNHALFDAAVSTTELVLRHNSRLKGIFCLRSPESQRAIDRLKIQNSNNLRIIELLLEHGSQASCRLLNQVISHGGEETLRLLLTRCPALLVVAAPSLMHSVVLRHSVGMLRVLLRAGVSVNSLNSFQQTPLLALCASDRCRVNEKLINMIFALVHCGAQLRSMNSADVPGQNMSPYRSIVCHIVAMRRQWARLFCSTATPQQVPKKLNSSLDEKHSAPHQLREFFSLRDKYVRHFLGQQLLDYYRPSVSHVGATVLVLSPKTVFCSPLLACSEEDFMLSSGRSENQLS